MEVKIQGTEMGSFLGWKRLHDDKDGAVEVSKVVLLALVYVCITTMVLMIVVMMCFSW